MAGPRAPLCPTHDSDSTFPSLTAGPHTQGLVGSPPSYPEQHTPLPVACRVGPGAHRSSDLDFPAPPATHSGPAGWRQQPALCRPPCTSHARGRRRPAGREAPPAAAAGPGQAGPPRLLTTRPSALRSHLAEAHLLPLPCPPRDPFSEPRLGSRSVLAVCLLGPRPTRGRQVLAGAGKCQGRSALPGAPACIQVP